MLLNNAHNAFIEEIKNCGGLDNYDKMGEDMISPMRVFSSPPKDGEPMPVHMDYCSEQLKNFDMAESHEQEGATLPEMQCLPKELIKAIGSTKRSLLDTLENVESEKKGRFQEGASAKWGLVLASRPTTRGHGDINIMDKAKAYHKKKSLEIPPSFKGNSFSCLDNYNLVDQGRKIDICIGKDNKEQVAIIDVLIENDKLRCLQFADLNPEVVLPDNLDVVFQTDSSPPGSSPRSKTGALLF
ncbi:hypothetical protein D1007_02082 [Hordeum vulgare]|nr:hypothetical protein D1007_02082 [Hordeum vulgare]